jgi:hypothetical protein
MAAILAVTVSGAAADSGNNRPGRAFFEQNVLPRLVENGCQMCHAVGYVHPNVMLYEDLLPYLAMGTAAETTPVIRKIANLRAIRPDIPTHPGGQRCETIGAEPCRSIVQWWDVEFGPSSIAGTKQ